jgi:hypothetical protein
VTITVDDNDFVDLALGKANAPSVCDFLNKSIIDILFI